MKKQDLAKDLLEMFTANKMAKAFFTNSGSEANDTQVYITISLLFKLPSYIFVFVFYRSHVCIYAGQASLVLQ